MLPLPSEASRLGSVLTDHQQKLLLDNFEQVVLMWVVSVLRLLGARLDRRRHPAAGYRAPVATAFTIGRPLATGYGAPVPTARTKGRHPTAGYRAPVGTALTKGGPLAAGYGAPVAAALTMGRSCCIILRLITTEDDQCECK